jgi:ribosomal protein S18 acetylase RimI-like enzyme
MTIAIRRVLPEEASLMTEIALAAKAHWGYPERWMRIWAPELTFDAAYFRRHESRAAIREGAPVGFYTLEERDGQGWLENLWIRPEYMGQGLGKSLFADALSLARSHGYRWLRWESDPNAVGFYEKLGGRRIGERHSQVEDQPRVLPILELPL